MTQLHSLPVRWLPAWNPPSKEGTERWDVLRCASGKGGIGKNPGDWLIPGLASLAWAFLSFFSCHIGTLQTAFTCRGLALELGKVSAYSWLFHQQL